jgi:hypothetical protein
LNESVNVFEDQALVNLAQKLFEKVGCHVNSDILSRKGSLQNLSSDLEVTVSSNSLIENKHPSPEVS